MNDDTTLLRAYLDEQSEAAFATLVQRHIGLVYSVALRRVGGDAHLAEDVTQKVFCDLARKAASLTGRATLGGWLYYSAHLASAAAVRSERRRKTRELEAHTMQTTHASPDADASRLRPVIDDAIVALKDDEREAIALRFFEQRSFAEIGVALRVTEEAARKRVDRALDKLRVALGRQGVTSPATALGIALTTIAATSVPMDLGAKIADRALMTTTASGGGVTLGGWLGVALPATAVLVLGVLALGQRRTNDELRGELSLFSANGAALASLQTENRMLARKLADVNMLRSTAAEPLPELPRHPAIAPPRSIAARISITAQGTISWNNDFVSLAEFRHRLRETKATANPESRIHVRALGSTCSAVAYVIDEARKADIEHLTVESNAKPDDKFSYWWF